MATIKINKNELRDHDLPSDGNSALGVIVLEDRIVGSSRWSIQYCLVFQWVDGKVYQTEYSVGATESQEESPWEYENEVTCTEVHQVEKTIKVWEAI